MSQHNKGCVAVDNSAGQVFVAHNNNITVVAVSQLLDFTFTKSIINEFVERYERFTIAVNFSIHFISISAKGFGTKLAVCAQNGSPFIVFFDLGSVYSSKSNVRLNIYYKVIAFV